MRAAGAAAPAPPRRRPGGWRRVLHRVAHGRRTKLLTGLFLFVTALAELTEGLFLDLHEALDPAHAILVLGGLMVMQSLAEIFEAVEFLDEAESDDPESA